jgi:thiamine pyridinylase
MRMRLISMVLAGFIGFVGFARAESPTVEPVTLRVALYPYVPEREGLFLALAQGFQRQNPGIAIEMAEVDPNKDYYGDGLLDLSADVYETDTILLSRMVAARKIAALTVSLADFSEDSRDAVTRGGQVYAVPHWLCGNYLFYRKDDAAIRAAGTWPELIHELARSNGSLLVDFSGKSTLGEWYLTLLADRIGFENAQTQLAADREISKTVIDDLNSILSACPTGLCRSSQLHGRDGYYARAFVRGEGRVYLGYSETIHYGLQDALENCRPGSPCLTEAEIAVRQLPGLAPQSTGERDGVGWVDGLAIGAGLSGAKKEIAQKFIAYATSPEAYRAVLKPRSGEAPRYLLPARQGLALTPSLYKGMLEGVASRHTAALPDLEPQLKDIGAKVNCALPIDRTDSATAASCTSH